MSDLRTSVEHAIDGRMRKLGFEKARGGVFLREVDSDAAAWVGIGLASRKRAGEVDADPMVGVRYEPVERLIPSARAYDATVFRPLYELVPGNGYTTWSFGWDNVDRQADALARAIEQAAMPFIQSLASPEAIEAALNFWAFADVRRQRLPALRIAEGDEAGARAELSRQKAQIREEGDPALLEQYERFAAHLLASR